MLFISARSEPHNKEIEKRLQSIEAKLADYTADIHSKIKSNKKKCKKIYTELTRHSRKSEARQQELKNALLHIYDKLVFPHKSIAAQPTQSNRTKNKNRKLAFDSEISTAAE